MSKYARVLLVEDDEDDYLLTSDYLQQLESHSFDIKWVTSPSKALELLIGGGFDICLLDYQLGAQSGLEVLQAAAENGCNTPIIMLTGQTDDELDQSALDAGAVDYLNKAEISTRRFARSIRYALARHDFTKERFERIKAETKNRSKDRFLAHLSHELRTPLTSILGYTELLLNNNNKQLGASDELNIILSNGKHLLSLLNDVLDLSKIAANKLELNRSKIDLGRFITDVFFLLRINAQDKGLSLEIEAKSALPQHIFVDSTRLRQILINLTYNAIKFTTQGKITIRIWSGLKKGREFIFFEVTDTGIGIPDDKLSAIFKPFEQIEDIVSRQKEGAGLGLAICTELVKRMGGEIKVHSEPNVGSQFTFSISPGDIINEPRQILNFQKSFAPELAKPMNGLCGRILVVDDIKDIRQLTSQICGSFGLDVETSQDGADAIEKCKAALLAATPYDLVLMDIHMPVLDGRQSVVKIRQNEFKNPVIALTAAALKGVRESLIETGFTDVVHKPINKGQLYEVLKKYLLCNPDPQVAVNVDSNPLPIEKINILLVEDDGDTAQLTKILLENLGATVQVASTGAACIELLQRECWHKVLLDMHLPDITGSDLALQIRQKQPLAEIIVVSGLELDPKGLQKIGASRSLLKPVNMEKLATLFE
ncbi:response regulator [Aliiglaciecola sp. LCG003]|uniref:response regulator n=1 Tax=Aliiglaciecola sp. LCG003 TaxID=3053655 RepID=UPI002573D784|nr:response regulator [Aliiglaciecola sp. LCG003]WJG09647.1 response regulator [Aliiglaciecola sp. LCG003]